MRRFRQDREVGRGVRQARRAACPVPGRPRGRAAEAAGHFGSTVPAAAVYPTIDTIVPKLDAGDIIIDGGNSYDRDDVRRAKALAARNLHYVDVGTSGGVWGLERGYCLMIGGTPTPSITSTRSSPRSRRASRSRRAPPGREKHDGTSEQGYLHCGPSGAGHFVKMIHNGIEYGIMAAYAEGMNVLHHADAGKHFGQATPRRLR